MQLHHLALKGAGHHPFAQALEAVHLGLHQTTPVVVTPDFPQAPLKALASEYCLVSVVSARAASFPKTGVLARWNHSLRTSLGNRIKAPPRVIRTVRTDTGDRLVVWDLCQQLGQHGGVSNGVAGDFDGAYFQRLRIDPEVHFAPCAAVLGPVLLALAFAFTQKFDACAVDQQVDRLRAGAVLQRDLQSLLATADGAEVRYGPVQLGQLEQALHHAKGLAQRLVKKAFDAQTELDRCIRE